MRKSMRSRKSNTKGKKRTQSSQFASVKTVNWEAPNRAKAASPPFDTMGYESLPSTEMRSLKHAAFELLRKALPGTYTEKTIEELELRAIKNADYRGGDDEHGNFGRVARIFSIYPNLKLSDPRVYIIALLMKHFDAVLSALNTGGRLSESIERRMEDLIIYAKIISVMERQGYAK